MEFSTQEIDLLIAKRRSIYPEQYSGEIIPDAIVEQLLENACWAPTHKITEPWHFTVFTGKGLKRLADFQASLYQKVSMQQGNFHSDKFKKLAAKPLKASHIIAIGMKRDRRAAVPEVEELAAVAAAVQNMQLSATAYGIGCYWGSGGITYMEEAKSFFGLEASDKLLGFLYLGIPRQWPQKGRRKKTGKSFPWIRE
ncbi:nitroreductase [Persicobacter sp. CCB-QB2]|uniref:nitroreductase family protein n=1 Tax=Persicobacter sp. CCB-QB2 TaxID=1561025 RepID=UPI0006A9E697|nr:nitroreductase [Persicobacter sp. CCB-QB2]